MICHALLKRDTNGVQQTVGKASVCPQIGRSNLTKYFLSNFIKVGVSDISNELH